MLAACAMLALAASLGMFQIITRFVLETPGRVDRGDDPLQPDLDGLSRHSDGVSPGRDGQCGCALPLEPAARMRRVLDCVVSVAALVLIAVIIWWGWDYANAARCRP